jgi:hypothetical protein
MPRPEPRCCHSECEQEPRWIIVFNSDPDGFLHACGDHVTDLGGFSKNTFPLYPDVSEADGA